MFSEEKIRLKLKEIRLQKGITEEFAATSLGRSSNSSVSRIESGQTRLNFEIVNKLCSLYGINPIDLFNGSRAENINPVTLQTQRKAYLDRLMYRTDTKIAEDVTLNIKELQPTLRKLGSVLGKLERSPVTIFDIDQDFSENIFLSNDVAIRYAISFAHELREYLGLGQSAIIDIQDLIWKCLNIPICGLDLGDDILDPLLL
jgi:transcriptional regulator with XRE-family HTH domain